MTHVRYALATLLVPLGLFVACDKKAEVAESKLDEKEAPVSNVKVELPPSPNFDEGKAPEQWEDGSYSIYGLRSKLDERVKEGENNKEIQVKGWVQEIYVAPPCPEGVCAPPKQPHVWITDTQGEQGKKRAMMVVNYRFSIPEHQAKMWKDVPQVILEKDKRYTFLGKFKQFSDTGFAFDRGLLEFVAYKPIDPATGQESSTWVYPPNSPWHPLTIQAQEAENAELAKKAQATAIKQP
ncbi:MAG: hypothetical protein IPH07_05660 [Deltaproteobacteria bacterium]|nr:hypothetical protein [Deltaproteobacteria bacterium]MBK8237519.1 hypothetical protein [Deltaproteobacteria bacterium]MBK8719888.1 hypothetical protein [Deltaproteobacteria bacterium]MBP7290715.1 hypothetical protein [Nannocystaceae bacterium]